MYVYELAYRGTRFSDFVRSYLKYTSGIQILMSLLRYLEFREVLAYQLTGEIGVCAVTDGGSSQFCARPTESAACWLATWSIEVLAATPIVLVSSDCESLQRIGSL